MNKDIESNKKQRMEFVEKWAAFVCDNDAIKWSRLQKEFLDSQFDNARAINLSKEQVRYIKKR